MIERYVLLFLCMLAIATAVMRGLFPLMACGVVPVFSASIESRASCSSCVASSLLATAFWTVVAVLLCLAYTILRRSHVMQ